MTVQRCVNRGPAPHYLGEPRPVLRLGVWVTDTRALPGDEFNASESELTRFAHKLEPVGGESPEGPATPLVCGVNESPPEEGVLELIDLEIYRVGSSEFFELPMGQVVCGPHAVLAAYGIELS